MKMATFIVLWIQVLFCLSINPVITCIHSFQLFFFLFIAFNLFKPNPRKTKENIECMETREKQISPPSIIYTETGCPVETLFLKNKIFRVLCLIIFFMHIVSEKLYLLFDCTFAVIEIDFLILLYENVLIFVIVCFICNSSSQLSKLF